MNHMIYSINDIKNKIPFLKSNALSLLCLWISHVSLIESVVKPMDSENMVNCRWVIIKFNLSVLI